MWRVGVMVSKEPDGDRARRIAEEGCVLRRARRFDGARALRLAMRGSPTVLLLLLKDRGQSY